MKGDLAALIHRGIYGKSDKLNSVDATEDFKEGHKFGSEFPLNGNIFDAFTDEWRKRGEPLPGTESYECLQEWKRGACAARLQKTCILRFSK